MEARILPELTPRLREKVQDAGLALLEDTTSAALCDALVGVWKSQSGVSVDVWTERILALMDAGASREHVEAVANIRNGNKLNICLNMIVKNEAHVIRRCLESVKPHIHSWCIVDTGSTDGTQEIVLEVMKDRPGRLHERPWVDFGANRNEAFELARHEAPTHIMFIDADETLESPDETPILAGDGYFIEVHHAGTVGRRFWMVREDYPGRWVGTIHEDMEPAGLLQMVQGARIVSHADGARSMDPLARSNGDLALLLKELSANPENARAWFYLGETYFTMGDFAQASRAFETRLGLDGDEQELPIVKARLSAIQEEAVHA
jgi:hypothetical protein